MRDAWLTAQGLEVYRVPVAEVFRDADGVTDGIILKALARVKDRK